MKIKIVNKSNNPVPEYSTEYAAGVDLRAFINKDVILAPLERVLVPTGLFIELPIGYEAQIRPRSGLALKHGLTILNTPGTIDADYRGELKVILVNLSNKDFVIKSGERVCQMVLSKHEKALFEIVDKLSDNTTRGVQGFGSTGVK